MKYIWLIAILFIMAISSAFAGDKVGTVKTDENGVITEVTAVNHDTTARVLTANDLAYIDSCPEYAGGNFRQAMREYILGGGKHVQPGERYKPNTSEVLWQLYQAWTAKQKVVMKVVPGPAGKAGDKGDTGPAGEDGAIGPKGDNGKDGTTTIVQVPAPPTVVNNYIQMAAPRRSYRTRQMGGESDAWRDTTPILSLTVKEVPKITNINTATGGAGGQGGAGGAGGSVGDITNVNNNTNTNINTNTNTNTNINTNTNTNTNTDIDNDHGGGCPPEPPEPPDDHPGGNPHDGGHDDGGGNDHHNNGTGNGDHWDNGQHPQDEHEHEDEIDDGQHGKPN